MNFPMLYCFVPPELLTLVMVLLAGLPILYVFCIPQVPSPAAAVPVPRDCCPAGEGGSDDRAYGGVGVSKEPIQTDLSDIGLNGLALHQAVAMVNSFICGERR